MTAVSAENTRFVPDHVYDLAISSLGFERRSTFLARMGLTARRNLCFAFDTNRVQAFDQNRDDARIHGLQIVDRPESEFVHRVQTLLREQQYAHIAVDISSMTRRRLSVLVTELANQSLDVGRGVDVDFFYCPAKFAPPAPDDIDILQAGPLPGFAGPLRRASLPVAAVLGLGYEPHRALGVIEYLEPSSAWLFAPLSSRDYEAAVQLANSPVLSLVPPEFRLTYDVSDPAGTLNALDSLAFAAGESRRLVMVPMGPKIFALVALLVSLGAGEKRPAVWRVGEGNLRRPLVAEENGNIVGLRTRFGAGS